MNKLLLSTICAVAVSSTASAFVLDLSSLNDQTLGPGTITNSYGTFIVVGPGTQPIQGGVINLNNSEALTIIYPSNVTYVGALISGSVSATNTTGAQTVQYTALENGTQVSNVTFNAVPEPSSTALLGLGGLALIMRRRK